MHGWYQCTTYGTDVCLIHQPVEAQDIDSRLPRATTCLGLKQGDMSKVTAAHLSSHAFKD